MEQVCQAVGELKGKQGYRNKGAEKHTLFETKSMLPYRHGFKRKIGKVNATETEHK